MGQKSNPVALRIKLNRQYDSCWYNDLYYTNAIARDRMIEKYLRGVVLQQKNQEGRLNIQEVTKKLILNLYYLPVQKIREKRSLSLSLRKRRSRNKKRPPTRLKVYKGGKGNYVPINLGATRESLYNAPNIEQKTVNNTLLQVINYNPLSANLALFADSKNMEEGPGYYKQKIFSHIYLGTSKQDKVLATGQDLSANLPFTGWTPGRRAPILRGVKMLSNSYKRNLINSLSNNSKFYLMGRVKQQYPLSFNPISIKESFNMSCNIKSRYSKNKTAIEYSNKLYKIFLYKFLYKYCYSFYKNKKQKDNIKNNQTNISHNISYNIESKKYKSYNNKKQFYKKRLGVRGAEPPLTNLRFAGRESTKYNNIKYFKTSIRITKRIGVSKKGRKSKHSVKTQNSLAMKPEAPAFKYVTNGSRRRRRESTSHYVASSKKKKPLDKQIFETGVKRSINIGSNQKKDVFSRNKLENNKMANFGKRYASTYIPKKWGKDSQNVRILPTVTPLRSRSSESLTLLPSGVTVGKERAANRRFAEGVISPDLPRGKKFSDNGKKKKGVGRGALKKSITPAIFKETSRQLAKVPPIKSKNNKHIASKLKKITPLSRLRSFHIAFNNTSHFYKKRIIRGLINVKNQQIANIKWVYKIITEIPLYSSEKIYRQKHKKGRGLGVEKRWSQKLLPKKNIQKKIRNILFNQINRYLFSRAKYQYRIERNQHLLGNRGYISTRSNNHKRIKFFRTRKQIAKNLVKKLYKQHLQNQIAQNLGFNNNVELRIHKLKSDYINANTLAEEIAYYMKRGTKFGQIKNRINNEFEKGLIPRKIIGMRISCSGRIGGRSKKALRARTLGFRFGSVPLNTFSAQIDYCYKKARTRYGIVGIKVWLNIKKKKERRLISRRERE